MNNVKQCLDEMIEIVANRSYNVSSISSSNKTKQEKVIKIFNPDKNGISEWIPREILENELGFGNNGNGRNGHYFGVKMFKWDVKRGKGTKVIALRLCGYNDNSIDGKSHPIGTKIRTYFKKNMKQACVNCGTSNELCIDHKNDLYNDEKVLNVNTQEVEDFQYLCNHCNIVKREVCQKTRKTCKRFGATNIPKLEHIGIDFIEGDEKIDFDNPNAMVGTYWYDPVAFMNFITKLK